ncbi:acetyltransferase [Bacillus sp. DX1.1]|uniref:acetyltransferase n=1 Tax=unclassified Bacillus (in: firmicutes) TaxID=185979 RepID=UPI00256FF090|nr:MULTISPECIES: acetyltransferase [unclassified Bacillus (in: firmicutes)]MDM5157344.1 acetyltransferase [Bacillus sp. DX1.1]WJE81570.1 acetyltransferase [Bacillus sp. DX3.1]
MRIIMIGTGGHSKVIRDIILSNGNCEVIGHLDDVYEQLKVEDGIYFGPISAAVKLMNEHADTKFVIAIGNNRTRKLIMEQLEIPNHRYVTLIHKQAIVSLSAKIGVGTVVMPGAIVNADVEIGNHVIVNTGAIVEHDNKVKDFVHISPNAVLTGSVTLGTGVHVGAGVNVIPNITIGDWAVIGAGATVICDIVANCTAVGIPARVTKKEL